MKHIKIDPTLITSRIVLEALQNTSSKSPLQLLNDGITDLKTLVPYWERDGNLTLCRLRQNEDEVSWGWAKLNPKKDEDNPTLGQHIAYNRALEKYFTKSLPKTYTVRYSASDHTETGRGSTADD